MAAEGERDTVSLGSLSSNEEIHDSGGEEEEDEEELELDTKQKHSLTIRVQKKVVIIARAKKGRNYCTCRKK